jgi:hypothetical protein
MARVYISSTFEDLKAHRQEVSGVVRRLSHEAVGMEDYNAEGSRPLDKCLQDVASCDAYVGIIGWRYGFVPTQDNPEALSITEFEYRKARELQKPLFIFLQTETTIDGRFADALTGQGDGGKLIKRLRAELKERHTVNLFDAVEDLGAKAATSLAGLKTAPRAVDLMALRELRALGALILKLYAFTSMFDELQSLYMDTRPLRSDRPEGLTVQILRAAARSGRDRLVSINSTLQESDDFLSEREKSLNQEHVKNLEGRVSDLADLAAAPPEPDAQSAGRRITVLDEFNYRLSAWLAVLNSMAVSSWQELRRSDLRALLDRLRPGALGSFVERVEDGYRQLTGEPPLFSKCDILAREHDLLKDTLDDFAMLRRELDQLDLDELRLRCKAIKRRVGQAREQWLAYVALQGLREPWETDLVGDGQDQWEVINQCEADIAAPAAAVEGVGTGIPSGLVDKLIRAQKFLELHFKSLDEALAAAFGKVKEAIGKPLMEITVPEASYG